MKSIMIAAALTLSTGAAFAAGTPVAVPPQPSGYDSGYVFPNDGSPSSENPYAHYTGQSNEPSSMFLGMHTSKTYLYPPADGADDDSN